MIRQGNNLIGNIHLGNKIGKIYVDDDLVYQSVSGPAFKDYEVGDIVPVIYNGMPINCIVVHQGNPDDTVYDDSCNGTWLMMADTQKVSGVTDSEYYLQTTIKSTLMPQIYNNFAADFKNKIRHAKIPCVDKVNGSVVNYTLGNGIASDVFILSLNEAGYTITSNETVRTNYDVGVKLDYFTQGNDSAANAVRMAYTPNRWLTRGFYNVGNQDYDRAATGADSGAYSPDNYASGTTNPYVRPAFIVDKFTKQIDVSNYLRLKGEAKAKDDITNITIGGKNLNYADLTYYYESSPLTIAVNLKAGSQLEVDYGLKDRLYVYVNGTEVTCIVRNITTSAQSFTYDVTLSAMQYNVSMTGGSNTFKLYFTEVS